MSQYMARRYHERRAMIVIQLGGRCYTCGSTESLEIDHVDRAYKRINLSKRLAGLPWWLVQQEIMACQLLCSPCHLAKGKTESSVGHGGGATGVRNCYCDLCKPLKRRYNRNRKVRIAMEEVLNEMGENHDYYTKVHGVGRGGAGCCRGHSRVFHTG